MKKTGKIVLVVAVLVILGQAVSASAWCGPYYAPRVVRSYPYYVPAAYYPVAAYVAPVVYTYPVVVPAPVVVPRVYVAPAYYPAGYCY